MNIPLGSLLKVGGAAYGAYGDDKTESIKEALAAAANQRAMAKAALDEKIGMRDLARLGPGDFGYGKQHNQELLDSAPGEGAKAGSIATAEVKPRIAQAVGIKQGEAPIAVKTALDTQTALAPGVISQAEGVANAGVAAANAKHKFAVDNPAPNFSFTTTTDPKTGQQKISAGNTHTGGVTDTGALAKAGGAGGSSLSPDDRLKMYEQAVRDDQEQTRIEDRVLGGKLEFGTGAGMANAAANAHGSPVSDMVGVLGNSALGAMDPDLQTYRTANKSYGRIMGNLQSKRYTDNQAAIEQDISGMKGNDLAETIRYKRELRKLSLADAHQRAMAPDAAPAKASTHPLLDKYSLAPPPG